MQSTIEDRHVVVMTAIGGRHHDYYNGSKEYTYRSPKLLSWMSADHIYLSVENTMNRPNALGVFRLRSPVLCPPVFGYSRVFRKEWGWDLDSFAKGYLAYEIHDIRIFDNGPISVHYGMGPQFAGVLTVADIVAAMSSS
jgi:hypothetical protein